MTEPGDIKTFWPRPIVSMPRRMPAPITAEGRRAFAEKRPPRFMAN
jgi:hypothetical protein